MSGNYLKNVFGAMQIKKWIGYFVQSDSKAKLPDLVSQWWYTEGQLGLCKYFENFWRT